MSFLVMHFSLEEVVEVKWWYLTLIAGSLVYCTWILIKWAQYRHESLRRIARLKRETQRLANMTAAEVARNDRLERQVLDHDAHIEELSEEAEKLKRETHLAQKWARQQDMIATRQRFRGEIARAGEPSGRETAPLGSLQATWARAAKRKRIEASVFPFRLSEKSKA